MDLIPRRKLVAVLGLLTFATLAASEQPSPAKTRKVVVNDGVELHYAERGEGVAVVFVHGSLGDYSVWDSQLGPFGEKYHAIAYSRRYNFPNQNKLRPNHSAIVEAEDLAAFIKKLGLGKVHVVGHSYGAYTALFLAVKHPEVVHTVTLAEPPVVFAGKGPSAAQMGVVKQARAAFAKGNAEDAVRAVVNSGREGMYEKISALFRQRLLRNAAELQALVTSDDMYPAVDRGAVRKMAVPTLLLCGEKSARPLLSSSRELERLLPEKIRRRVVIRGADHGMWFQQPAACRQAVLEFLEAKKIVE
jgi:pimeloyl-ACP methyl ester carboxylesterase